MTSHQNYQLSEKCLDQLHRYVELLDRWRRITNLVSEDSFAEVWERHIQDSIFIQKIGCWADRWLDFGTGAGFPGIVIGVLIAEREHGRVHCVESDSRKCAFLRTVVDELNIPVKVHNSRVESLSLAVTGPVDVVTARGFSSIAHILALSQSYLTQGALAILPRGRATNRNIETVTANLYTIEVQSNPNHKDGAFFIIRQRAGRL